MKRKLFLVALLFVAMFAIPNNVSAYGELTHESGSDVWDSTHPDNSQWIHFDYTIYDDVEFGGFAEITDDIEIGFDVTPISVLCIMILDADDYYTASQTTIWHTGLSPLFQMFINESDGKVEWNYKQYTSVAFDIHIIYWYYAPCDAIYINERRMFFDYEHWDWARYQPYTTTTTDTTSTTTTDTSTTSTTTSSNPSTPTPNRPREITLVELGVIIVGGAILVGGAFAVTRTKPEVTVNGKVLILCPYCGKKYEQGLEKCPNCNG